MGKCAAGLYLKTFYMLVIFSIALTTTAFLEKLCKLITSILVFTGYQLFCVMLTFYCAKLLSTRICSKYKVYFLLQQMMLNLCLYTDYFYSISPIFLLTEASWYISYADTDQ